MALRRKSVPLKPVAALLSACALAAPAFANKSSPSDLNEARALIRLAGERFAGLRRSTGARLRDARESLRVSAKLLPASSEPVWVDFKAYWRDLRAAEKAFLVPGERGSFSRAREQWEDDYLRLRQDILSTRNKVEEAATGLGEASRAAAALKSDLGRARELLGRKKSGDAEELRERLERLERSFSAWERPVLGSIASELGSAGPAMGGFVSDFDAGHVRMETQLDTGRYSEAVEARRARVQALEAGEAERVREAQDRLAGAVDRALNGLERHSPQWEVR